MPATSIDEPPRVLMVITTRHIPHGLLLLMALCLSLFVLRTYYRDDDPRFGWTRMIFFGQNFAADTLPRLQRTPHYIHALTDSPGGYDGQFYAQEAIDPSLRDPAFDGALDNPAYRARAASACPPYRFASAGANPGG